VSAMSTDRIEKQVVIQAPRARVWRALADVERFGRWFGVVLEGPFRPGARVRGRVTHPGYEHVPFEVVVETVEPERHLAWRGHPNPIDPDFDTATEPATLVVFELSDVDGGTLLTVIESGFDALPPARRRDAFRGNELGWSRQVDAIARYVTGDVA
jgi:uncharacterized protein YndB with AHSA1/START domain